MLQYKPYDVNVFLEPLTQQKPPQYQPFPEEIFYQGELCFKHVDSVKQLSVGSGGNA